MGGYSSSNQTPRRLAYNSVALQSVSAAAKWHDLEKQKPKGLSFLGEDRKVFVGLHRSDFGGTWDIDDAKLRTALEKFGEVENANFVVDKTTNANRGFAFVKFAEKKKSVALAPRNPCKTTL